LEKVSKPEKWKEGLGVKGRNEPVEIINIAHIVAKIKGIEVEELAEKVWENSERLFWKDRE
jgi:TatD DNase family protein